MDNNKINDTEIHEKPTIDTSRRDALIKLGKYSAGATAVSFTLSSKAQSGTHHGGWGGNNQGGFGNNRRPNRRQNNRNRRWWQFWF